MDISRPSHLILRSSALSRHGGNIYRASEELEIPEGSIIDFSASINPLGVPESVISEIKSDIRHIANYPDPDTKKLRLEIAKKHGIEPESILCGNGSTELIYLIARALRPENILIPAPTFSEYEKACAGSQAMTVGTRNIRYLTLNKNDHFDIDTAEFIHSMTGCNMAFLCNPNNPTGRLLKKEDVVRTAKAAKELKCYLVVDEAFIDFLPEESVIHEVEKNPYLIVLRSMTKFYALTGLRLGYGVFPSGLVEVMQQQKEPWSVNILAQRAGVVAMNDSSYKNETFKIIRMEKQFMEEAFEKMGLDYLPSSANYYLIRPHSAEEVRISLRKKGILVRGCSDFIGLDESYIRVAVKSRRDNALLIEELSLCPEA